MYSAVTVKLLDEGIAELELCAMEVLLVVVLGDEGTLEFELGTTEALLGFAPEELLGFTPEELEPFGEPESELWSRGGASGKGQSSLGMPSPRQGLAPRRHNLSAI